MKKKKTDVGVSEVLGTVLLLGMAVALFSVLSAVVLSYPFHPSTPEVNIIGFIDGNNIILEHLGGENLELDTKILVTINNTYRYSFTVDDDSILDDDLKNDGYWNIGENVIINATDNPVFNRDIKTSKVDVTVVDVKSSSVVLMGCLQEGSGAGSPSSSPGPSGTSPVISNFHPVDGETDVDINPTLSVDVEDLQGDSMDVMFMTNASGSWQQIGSIQNGGNGTYIQSTTSVFDDYDTEYWWSVNVTDGSYWTNVTCSFTTRSISVDTLVNTISPYEVSSSPLTITAAGDPGLDSVELWYRWSDDNWTANWVTLTYDDFESGFGNYTAGGNDCSLYTDGNFAHQGSNAADIQDNSGDASSFYHTSDIDVDTPGYTSIKIDFWFYAHGMETDEDFWVRYYDGTQWITVADYNAGEEFENGQFYHRIIWINETDYTFPADMKIKFQCDASNNNDDVYIDEIYINATAEEDSGTSWTAWSNVDNPDTNSPWSWNFDFPNGPGYYEFYSIGRYDADVENAPNDKDAGCYYNPS